MKKINYLRAIQARLPIEILLKDDIHFDFTEDEYVVILSWIKNFNEHYKLNGKNENMLTPIVLISKRLRIDFYFYRFPKENGEDVGKHFIYLGANNRNFEGQGKPTYSVKELEKTFQL